MCLVLFLRVKMRFTPQAATINVRSFRSRHWAGKSPFSDLVPFQVPAEATAQRTGWGFTTRAAKEQKTMQVKAEFEQMSRQDIEGHLVTKATNDPAFRAALLANPRAALDEEIGLSVPADFQLQVIEESPNSLCLVLPPAQGELSNMELESVAGGKGSSQGGKSVPRNLMPTGVVPTNGGRILSDRSLG